MSQLRIEKFNSVYIISNDISSSNDITCINLKSTLYSVGIQNNFILQNTGVAPCNEIGMITVT